MNFELSEEQQAIGELARLEAEAQTLDMAYDWGIQVSIQKADRAGDHFVALAPGQDIRQGALARAVRAHHRVDLAGRDRQLDAL